ncbi:reverse transcriptase domain-containing protein [Trichonephila clavipes]|nr:reverse transcriptase domain-containing protein [Trichonephila clavipes]
MGALLSARLSDKIATALILPVSRFYWTDSSITYYWIKGDFNRHKVFVKNRIKEIQKLSDPKEWRYCKGKDNPADLISRGLPLNDLKNNKIWWYGPKWLTMKQTEWPLFSEPIIETEINNDKLELKKSINQGDPSHPSFGVTMQRTSREQETFLMNGTREICKSNRIQLFSAEEGIEWNFIPPASPHFGGLWEANIKSMKRILLRVAKSAIMNFEELTTLMAQIEAVLNSRPLSPLSSDPNDLNPLTPGHFLTNCAISSFPEPYTASDSLSYHSRWKLIQSLRDKFWNRWSTEYLTHFQTRAKWSVQNPNLMENQLVLLKDPNTPQAPGLAYGAYS